MKVIYISNYMNHHILHICNNLFDYLKGEFEFIALTGTPQERLSLGYEDYKTKLPYVSGTDKYSLEEIKKKCLACDVLIVGSCPDSFFIPRLKARKIVIKFSERYFKYNNTFSEKIRSFCSGLVHITRFNRYNIEYFCCSSYTKEDVTKFRKKKTHFYKWGYFPETSSKNIDTLLSNKEKKSIVWVARFIDWKHPEAALYLADHLKKQNKDFSITMIGNGPMLYPVISESFKLGVNDCIKFTGGIPTNQVREHMEKADIFIMTSDRKEGWGAALNEAMSSACAPVANTEAGSVGFLIKDGENGFVYDGTFPSLTEKVKILLDDEALCSSFQEKAYSTIETEWNPDEASKRLYDFMCELYYKNNHIELDSGPCSKA